ncbi:hypothetical protein NEUTE1DRAFT_43249 [Neurospora tetrasperma FGSC 2508]|uniref:Uncharacterized protein n=1 Tax=Neurospora tetrasperma (strain FGSC 2508 / ATCC MYA-4615 / P0657) TaxID=510951 RepID=F8MML3_NEUT8|nr:uncharacterized protein NEUTE1DRAFT_43249 [Neurospora tetrasperma FGSC 2508]EGO57887.1 hypothetical protein NEUTE1DRAFT_43249 [Neurospora tetrasperma FGSC 2508]EGZ71827.1 hypothetical protein NEUTE2DRAFT_129211 [Neurospora tetrasperma FGSC 2509]
MAKSRVKRYIKAEDNSKVRRGHCRLQELELSSFSQLGRVKDGCLMVFGMSTDMVEDKCIQLN